jgi:predicted lipid carrier protein YhbT
MMLREEDPDTLFFNRKLIIEGDTELGLIVKNLLDSVDWSTTPLQRFMAV